MIGFIGAGNMAGAIIRGINNKELYRKVEMCVFDIIEEKKNSFSDIALIASGIEELVSKSDIVFLCAKPQGFPDMLLSIKNSFSEEELGKKTFVSIAAGISTDYVTERLYESVPVIRVMPNTPLMVGFGSTVLCRNKLVSDSVFEMVNRIFSSLGVSKVISEEYMNKIIGVTSSSPAYLYLLAKALRDGAVEQGFNAEDVVDLIIPLFSGVAEMLHKNNDFDEMIKMVASPGGTTLAALNELEKGEFVEVVKKAMVACTKRADELSK